MEYSTFERLGGEFASRLQRLPQILERDVDRGKIPGAVILVARGGRLELFEAVGYRAPQFEEPMATDSIFRIASLTKPITSVAALMLVEQGLLDLGAPAADYLPELRDLRVGIEAPETGRLTLVPPHRPMTVHDLMRHTSGITYGHFGTSAIKSLYQQTEPLDVDQTLAEMVDKLSRLPLAHHPGEIWDYGMSTDVLGRIIEVVSAQGLDQFLAERIFEPLGMIDTGFYVPDPHIGRVAEPQASRSKNSTMPSMRPAPTHLPGWLSGGSGLLSTAGDYWRFAQMLLDRGRHGEVQLLSPRMIDLMTANHLPAGLPRDAFLTKMMADLAPAPEYGQGFGLGVAVRLAKGLSPLPGNVGDYFWQGATGPYFWVDPSEKLIGILFTQVRRSQVDRYRWLVRTMVYGALPG